MDEPSGKADAAVTDVEGETTIVSAAEIPTVPSVVLVVDVTGAPPT